MKLLLKETKVKPVFKTAIYVNRAKESLPHAIEGKEISKPLTKNRAWTRARKLFDEA